MKKTIASLIFAATAGLSASAAVILAPGAQWEYTFTDPSGTPTWSTGIGGTGWANGNAPFGNTVGGDFGANTTWPTHAELWVRRTFDLTGFDLTTATWDLGVDNGYNLFINGTHISGANAEGFTFRWEYSGAIAAGNLNPGINWVAVALEDHGGLTAFDMQISAEPANTVPETAATILLLGLATSMLAFHKKNKRI